MADAFDRWTEWIHKPPGDRTGLSSDVHATVMLLPEEDRTDRQRVNAAVWHWAELRRTGRTAWIYLNDYDNGERRHVGDAEWMKVFTSADAADRWFKQHDPEGLPGSTKSKAVRGNRPSGSMLPTRARGRSETPPGPGCSPPSRRPRNGLSKTPQRVGSRTIRSRNET